MKMSLLKILKMTAALGMLAVVLMMMMPMDAKAAGTGTLADPWECGNTGDGGSASAVTAYIDGTTLIIEGSGKMADYSAGTQPWNGMSFTSVEVRDGITWVGDFAFNNMSGLTSASIADTVTTIGQNAFSENTSLTSVRLSKNLKGIVNNTFRACTGLTNIDIPEGATFISNNAFHGTGLTSINIPRSVRSMGAEAFRDCSNLSSVTFEDISANGVGGFSDNIFLYCSNVRNVVIGGAAEASQIVALINKCPEICNASSTISVPEEFVSDVSEAKPTLNVKAIPVNTVENDKKEEEEEASVDTPAVPSKSVYEEKMESLISEIGVASGEAAKTAGEKKTVYLKDVNLLPLSVMKALKSNPNVNLDMTYTYNGFTFHVVIPGTAVIFDENIPWYGPLWLYANYGQISSSNLGQATYREYIVQKGDTLRKIAAKFSTSLEELLIKNPQIEDKDKIVVGEKIYY